MTADQLRQAADAARDDERTARARRIQDVVDTLARPPFSFDGEGVTRYAFSPPYQRVVEYVGARLEELDFAVSLDPVGNLVARNRPRGVPVIGLGSHCDSVREGGRWDGILGMVAAIEVASAARERGIDLPLQVVSWVEEEASGFGHMLLGSRVAAGLLAPEALHDSVRSLDDGRSFAQHASDAGVPIDRLGEVAETLEDLGAWMEIHIEQGRVLQDEGYPIGVVDAIAGYVHADLHFSGRTDHAGATPMPLRHDAGVVAAACVVELERLAGVAGGGLVATSGELALTPGFINAVPGGARLSLDIRGPEPERVRGVLASIHRYAEKMAHPREVAVRLTMRQTVEPVSMDPVVVDALGRAAEATGCAWRKIHSGAAHDTMCVAGHVPSAMVFIPCREGVSHAPHEDASADDAAIAAEIVLAAAIELAGELRLAAEPTDGRER